jgi:hypothetical protein
VAIKLGRRGIEEEWKRNRRGIFPMANLISALFSDVWKWITVKIA